MPKTSILVRFQFCKKLQSPYCNPPPSSKMGKVFFSFPSNLLPTYIPNYPESFSQIRGDLKFAKIRAFSRGHHPLLKQ